MYLPCWRSCGLPAQPDPARPVDPYSASRVAADVPNDLAFLVGLRSRVRLSGNGPRALAIVGAQLFVANYFSDTVERVDLQTPSLTPVTIALGPPAALSVVRRGEMLFNDATISFQGWQSCASCHSQDAACRRPELGFAQRWSGQPQEHQEPGLGRSYAARHEHGSA